MRNINVTVFIVLGFFLSAFEPALSEQSKRPDWYVYAQEYIRLDNELAKLYARESATSKEFDELNNYRDDARQKYITSVPPSDKEIESLLSSSSNQDITIGVVSIYLSEAFRIESVDSLIKILTSINDPSIEGHVLLCLSKAPSEAVTRYEAELLDYIKKADEGWMLFPKLEILLKLTPGKSSVILSEWMGRDSSLLRRVAYIYLGKLGPAYQENALDNLVKTKKIDKAKFMDELFDGRERRPQAN